MLQFHGDEEEGALAGWALPVIRALRVRGGEALGAISRTHADYVLLDTFHSALYGGSGVARPLDELTRLDLSRVFISGGLNAANVAEAAALGPFAVDAASGVESSPGIKDHLKLRSFVANAKSAR
jgi:phosphoribosylanthranilate isomerase